MPSTGDSFITILKKVHLEWDTYRHKSSRDLIYGEEYLQIPENIARQFQIYNANQPNAITDYICNSIDGFLQNVTLKTSGCSHGGSAFAKQFHGSGDLKLLGDLFNHINTNIGDKIKISWLSPTNIVVEQV